ncbi:MAG TPA: hypothetical protein VIO37_00605 [Candidatus Dormibacteraeota bacterium]|jgi:hypothetical protein
MGPEEKAISEADEVFFNNPGVAIVKWDSAIQAVSTEWQGWADHADFVAVLEASLGAIKKHRASRGLVDSLRQQAVPQPDQDFVNRDWFPRALVAGLRRLAMVIPHSALAMMSIEDVLSRLRGTMLNVAYFATVAEAREWLTFTAAGPPTPVSRIS